MKLSTKCILALAAGAAMISTTAFAGPSNWPPQYPDRVTTSVQAMACCRPGVKVALACKDCKTVMAKPGEDKKDVMSWFKPQSTHACSGCGGRITVTQLGGDKGLKVGQLKHVCSKCGEKSAFTCATHAA